MSIGCINDFAKILVRFKNNFVVGRYGDLFFSLWIVAVTLVHPAELKLTEASNINAAIVFKSAIDHIYKILDEIVGKLF